MQDCSLYLISPETIDPDSFATKLEQALDAGPVDCFQLRLPDASDAEIKSAAERLKPVCWDRDVAFLLCDRADLAKSLGLDGVHLEADVSANAVKQARKTLGDDASIGASCLNSRHIAMLVGEAGADYVSFGPFFHSPTKDLPPDETVADTLHWWSVMMELPCVAVGGVSPENCEVAAGRGADFVAAISAVWDHADGPGAAVRAFGEALQANR